MNRKAKKELGTALVEFAMVMPLLILVASVLFNTCSYIFNFGRAVDAVYEGITYAPKAGSVGEIRTRVEEVFTNGCFACENASVSVAADSATKRVSIQLTAEYKLSLFFIPGVYVVPFSTSQVGFFP